MFQSWGVNRLRLRGKRSALEHVNSRSTITPDPASSSRLVFRAERLLESRTRAWIRLMIESNFSADHSLGRRNGLPGGQQDLLGQQSSHPNARPKPGLADFSPQHSLRYRTTPGARGWIPRRANLLGRPLDYLDTRFNSAKDKPPGGTRLDAMQKGRVRVFRS